MTDTFTIHDKEINVEEIMKEIREEIRKKGIEHLPPIEFEFDLKEDKLSTRYEKFRFNVDVLNRIWSLSDHYPIFSHRKIIGPLIVVGKKIAKRLMKWYASPLLKQQTEYNAHNVRAMNELRDMLTEIIKEHRELEGKIRSLKQEQKKLLNVLNETIIEEKFDYRGFEDKFRGSENTIREKQKKYLNFFRDKENVIDLGCGRGEFLELLLEHGVKAKGIDRNPQMVKLCKGKGLPIEQQDIFDFLQSCRPNSLGGIFIGHVIEHMPFSRLIELVELAKQKLAPEAWFVAESPNPQCLAVFSHSFYLDPSHNRPVHPYTIQHLMENLGYVNVQILYSSRMPESLFIPEDFQNEELKEISKILKRWEEILFGYQDFAVAGQKGKIE